MKSKNLDSLLFLFHYLFFSCDFTAPCSSSFYKPESSSPTLEDSVDKGDFSYWLTQEDIGLIARLSKYDGFRETEKDFDVTSNQVNKKGTSKGKSALEISLSNAISPTVSTLSRIVNLEGNHWVSLLAHRKTASEPWQVYYADSFSNVVSESITEALKASLNINKDDIQNVINHAQQKDGHNCGVYSIENLFILQQGINQGSTPEEIRTQIRRHPINPQELRIQWAREIKSLRRT